MTIIKILMIVMTILTITEMIAAASLQNSIALKN